MQQSEYKNHIMLRTFNQVISVLLSYTLLHLHSNTVIARRYNDAKMEQQKSSYANSTSL